MNQFVAIMAKKKKIMYIVFNPHYFPFIKFKITSQMAHGPRDPTRIIIRSFNTNPLPNPCVCVCVLSTNVLPITKAPNAH